MGHCRGLTRYASCGLTATAALALVATSASAQALGKGREGAFLTAPLNLKDEGSFFIGGVNKTTQYATSSTAGTNQSIVIGQMYVEFQIPEGWNPEKTKKGLYPVIMVHGSTHTGACVQSTPDYKEGWAPYYVRNGFPVFVVDQSGRGRSGFDESVIHEGKRMYIDGGDDAGATALIPNFGRITSNGSYTAWFGHLVLPGTATTTNNILLGELMPHGWRPDDPSPPTVHPNPAGYLPAFGLSTIDRGQTQGGFPAIGGGQNNTPTGVAPIGLFPDPHFGPPPYGPATAYALHYYKQLVPNAEVTLPGSICPSCVPQTIVAANTWTPFNLALLVEKIAAKTGGAIVATHSQSGIMGHHMTRILKERGHLSYLKGLVTIEGGCSFANSGLTPADFDHIPYLALKGDYTVFSAACQASVDAINASPTHQERAEYIQLDAPEYGGAFNGVTHMMMDGTNALKVADIMLDWGKKYINH
jgi:hypothetical protein